MVATVYSIDIKVDSSAASTQKDSFEYIVFGKLVDKENMSTAMRVSTIINDMRILSQHPITGVGNGMQGYWYSENVPDWCKLSYEVENLLNGKAGIANGG